MLKEKSRQFLKSVGCFLLTASLLMTSGVQDVSASFAGGVAPTIMRSKGGTRGNSVAPKAWTTSLIGRKLVGTGWVIGLAKYNTDAEHGYNALTSEELAGSYKNGVLVYNDAETFDACATDGCGKTHLKDEVNSHNLPIGYNVLINGGYYFVDLEFRLRTYSCNISSNNYDAKLLRLGYDPTLTITDSNERMSCVPFTQEVMYFSKDASRLQVAPDSPYETALSGVYKVDVSEQDANGVAIGATKTYHKSGYPKACVDSCSCGTADSPCSCDIGDNYCYKSNEYYKIAGEDASTLGNHKPFMLDDEDDFIDYNNLSICSSCDLTWKDKASMNYYVKTCRGTLRSVYTNIATWEPTLYNLYDYLGYLNYPTDYIYVTNGYSSGGNIRSFNSFSFQNEIVWLKAAKDLLPDANLCSHIYDAGDYVFEEDFAKTTANEVTLYYGVGVDPSASYNIINDYINEKPNGVTISVTSDEVEKNTLQQACKESLKDVQDKLYVKPDFVRVKHAFELCNKILTKSGTDYFRPQINSAKVTFKVGNNQKPVAVASTLKTGSSGYHSRNLQYNVYNTGGRVSINGGGKASFRNDIFDNPSTYVLNSNSQRASELTSWFNNRVGCTTYNINESSVGKFTNILADTSTKFKHLTTNGSTTTTPVDLKIANSHNALGTSQTLHQDVKSFNRLWAVSNGESNKDFDWNDAEYRGILYDRLTELRGTSTLVDGSGNSVSRDDFVYNIVTNKSEDWIYVLTIVPVVLIENYISGDDAQNLVGDARGQSIIAVYPSCEFLRYNESKSRANNGKTRVGNLVMGTDSFSAGGYLSVFAGMAGVYSVGHKQYLSNIDGGLGWNVTVASGITGTVGSGNNIRVNGNLSGDIDNPDADTNASDDLEFGAVPKIFKDRDMNLEPDGTTLEEPDFKGFLVYGANLDMTVRLTSNITAYLDSKSFDAEDTSHEKHYSGIDYSNLGLRNFILNDEEEHNNLKLDKKPYDVDLGFEYEHKGVRYWYSNRKNFNGSDKKLFRTVLTKNIATEEITGVKVNSSNNKAVEYNDYDVLNETSQFFIQARNTSANPITVYNKNGGDYLHNIIQNVDTRTKINYVGTPIGGHVSFGKQYTTQVDYEGVDDGTRTLANTLHKKISSTGDWYSGVYVKYNNNEIDKSINRFIDRKNGLKDTSYIPLKTRAMVLAAKMLLNGVELTDTKANGSSSNYTYNPSDDTEGGDVRQFSVNSSYHHPGTFVIKGNTDNGYKVSGSGQFATVSVQVYEKRKANKSYLKVFDVRVDNDGNFEDVDYESGWVPSVNEYYYDEESYIDWTSDSAQHDYNIKLITDRDDAEIASNVAGANYINYLAVPNNKSCSHGNTPLTKSDITSSCYKVDDLCDKLGIVPNEDKTGKCIKGKHNETGINVGTSPENYGYTIYVIRYYTKYKYYENPSEGEKEGEITSDSALYLEDYEISHVYPNIYNTKDDDADSITQRYIRTSQAYTYKEGTESTHHSWNKDYGDLGEPITDKTDDYKDIVSDANRYIWQNRLTSNVCNSIIGKYDTTGTDRGNNLNDDFGVFNGDKFAPILGSDSFKTWSYPQNSALAIPFATTLVRGSNQPLGYAVVLSRDIVNDKVVISGLTDLTVSNPTMDYNDTMQDNFISYLAASGVIKKGKDVKDIPQNDDAITHNDVGANDTIATRDTNHRSTSATNTQSIRYGHDIDSRTEVAGQDTISTYTWNNVLDTITFTGGWHADANKYKDADVYGDDLSTGIVESTPITDAKYNKPNGVGQSVILKHDINKATSQLKTLMCNKDRHGNRSHGFVGNINVYQYYYKYYTGSRPVGGTTASTKDEVLGGTNRRGATATPPSRDYLFEAKDYFTAYSGTASKKGQLPVYTDTNGAYTQAYRMVHDLIVNFYPEVQMSMQVPTLEEITIKTGVMDDATSTEREEVKVQLREYKPGVQVPFYEDTIWTIGEYIRKTKLTSLYFVSIKSSGNTDTESQLYSDNSTSNANSNALGNNIPSLYAGADVSLTVKPKFTIWTYGYSLDLINKAYDDNNNIVSREAQSHGDASLNFTYKAIVNDEVDIYTAWGNPATPSTRDALKSDFEDFTKMVGMSLESDITLQTVNQTSFNNGIIEKDTSLNKEEYQNFSTSVGKLDSNPVNNGNNELVYTLEVRHGKLVEDPDTISGKSVEALIRQMAVDYYGIENSGSALATERVTDAQYSAMRDMLNSSGMVASIVESIESDTDADNTSTVIGHKILGTDNMAQTNKKADGTPVGLGSFKENEHGTIEGKWYDERVKTFVIRRFFQESKLDSIVLDDKLDYNMGMSSNGGNDNTQNGYKSKTYSWFMNLYMDYKLIDSSKLANPANADYFTRDGVYGTNADNWYSPSRNNNNSAYKAGTGLIRNLYLPNVDFNIVSDAVAN